MKRAGLHTDGLKACMLGYKDTHMAVSAVNAKNDSGIFPVKPLEPRDLQSKQALLVFDEKSGSRHAQAKRCHNHYKDTHNPVSFVNTESKKKEGVCYKRGIQASQCSYTRLKPMRNCNE